MLRLLIACLLISSVTFAQKKKEVKPKIELATKGVLRDGNKAYNNADFAGAEEQYKKALEVNPNYEKANYNLGNAMYQQNNFDEATARYELIAKTSEDKFVKAENYHNIGNAMMKKKNYDGAIEAYKNSLRNNPNDDETRYNLALAQKLRKKEADNKKDKKNNKDNKNKNDKNKKDKNNKDKNKNDKSDQGKDKDKDKKGNDNKDKNDKNKDQNQNKDQQDQDKKQQKKPNPNKLSKQQMQQLLEAMNNEENKTQKKINAKKAKGRKIKQEKDW